MLVTNKRHRDGSIFVHVFSHNKRRRVHAVIIGLLQQKHTPLMGPGLTVERERERENVVKTWKATISMAELQKNTHAKSTHRARCRGECRRSRQPWLATLAFRGKIMLRLQNHTPSVISCLN